MSRRHWDGHCPECHSDDIELDLVRAHSLKKHCAECGHDWNEEREIPLLLDNGNVNNAALAA